MGRESRADLAPIFATMRANLDEAGRQALDEALANGSLTADHPIFYLLVQMQSQIKMMTEIREVVEQKLVQIEDLVRRSETGSRTASARMGHHLNDIVDRMISDQNRKPANRTGLKVERVDPDRNENEKRKEEPLGGGLTLYEYIEIGLLISSVIVIAVSIFPITRISPANWLLFASATILSLIGFFFFRSVKAYERIFGMMICALFAVFSAGAAVVTGVHDGWWPLLQLK